MKINKTIFLILAIVIEGGLIFGGINYIKAAAQQIKETHNELIAWQQKDDDIMQLQADYQQNQSAIETVNKALPPNDKVIEYFEELERIATKSGLALTMSMSAPLQEDDQKKVASAVLKLATRGSYYSIKEYIQNLEQNYQLNIIQAVNLQAPQGLNTEVIAEIVVKTYFSLP